MFLLLSGIVLGALLYKIYLSVKKQGLENLARKIITEAEKDAAFQTAAQHKKRTESEQQFYAENALRENKMRAKVEQLSKEKSKLDTKLHAIEKKEQHLLEKEKSLILLEKEYELRASFVKEELFAAVEKENASELVERYREMEKVAKEQATTLLLDAMQRVMVPDITTSTILLPNDEIKAKIIGKAGKNCKAFKEITGVELLIDESLTIGLSSFDLERREIAKLALQELIADGRINPQLIQEATSKATNGLPQLLLRHGQDAALACKVQALSPELLVLIGKMSLRRTHQQNLLEHSIEVSHLMGMAAAELGLDSALAAKIGLLHDIGKVLSTDVAPTHALAGYKIVKKCGETDVVANGIGCHHGEMEPLTLEAKLCAPCDRVSATRAGARSDSSEKHFEKIALFEKEALSFKGVEKAFAIDGGRELQVFVCPEQVDDLEARALSKAIAEKLEKVAGRLVRVTVLRQIQAATF